MRKLLLIVCTVFLTVGVFCADYNYTREYDNTYKTYNVDGTLISDISTALPDKDIDFHCSELIVVIHSNVALNPEEQSTLTDTVNQHKAAYLNRFLANLKDRRIKEVEDKNTELFELGFSYDGKSFSLNDFSISFWNQLWNLVHMGALTLPQSIEAMDKSTYILASIEQLDGWYITGQIRVQYVFSTARTLKTSIKAATTIEEVNAIVDDRT